MALAAARRDKPAGAARAKAARPWKALTARAPLQPRTASRPEALLPVQLAFPPQAPRQAVALRAQRVPRLPVLPVPPAPRRQALQRVPRLLVLPVPPAPRRQALRAQRVPLFRPLPVL